jgi:hypothetical protein
VLILFAGLGIVFVVCVVRFMANCCPLDHVLLVGLLLVDTMHCKFVAVSMVVVFWLAATWLVVDKFAIAVIRGAMARVYLGGVRSLLAVALVTLAGLAGTGAAFCFLFGW